MENLGKSFHVMECRVMECHGTVMECNGMSCHGMSWYGHGMSCNLRIWEDHGISFHVMENQGKSFHVMECRVMECRVMECNVMVRSWNVMVRSWNVWAMEAIPCLTRVHGLRISNVYPQLMNWCCKNKLKKLDNEFTDEMEAISTLTPTTDELQQDYMVYFNPENAMGDIPETSKDDVMMSKSDKELLSESVTREIKSNANQDRRKKKGSLGRDCNGLSLGLPSPRTKYGSNVNGK
ncbi:hypothetical protein LWI29_003637 [Acer saccharum]|uniref:Uncharacterized protein n=1 Tax=Acer saccharum TaxID=4024 RepID=A0AA39VWJ7_ACESA|nr:hypothetical protein LWI29_003637 [Acer saccharum]